ncbi:hypothetical protein J2Z21_002850 [Streptomyces griseochromogenes]|uniref:Uncharacterized protein n=1 Tax=Streptomyces griseochromogenes TaxID=68214 RepID=A0A1B1AXQ3_9ACTN|nr:hypothetical protein [Streptomyces griseochromogenes]ANP51366.1 hypothetical protein AVL59_18645 [Streptomyces griseochromogenes]MBP2049914.1 hypothetical protein [Streptomyces griseochromogenes]
MTAPEITPEEQVELDKALYDALNPLVAAVRSRETGLPAERMWDADPIEVALSALAAWKVVDVEVRRLTAQAAATAGSYGASYEQLGAVWGITRQGARKKWPDAVRRPTPVTADARTLALFGGTAELVQASSGDWSWTGKGADGASSMAGDGARYATAEEAAAHAGAFLKGHALDTSGRP